MTTALATLANKFAERFGVNNQQDLIVTLKATAFKGQVTDAQMTALMLVAQQYSLNPWTREIYAFPDKNNGIVPVVGVDGWSRIMNDHPQFDGMEFEQDDEKCTCTIYRKDRSHPIKATEYMAECKRSTQPWQSHPRRMLRHKAMIQCARLAFGFVGIYEQDEAERIVESEGMIIDGNTGEIIKKEPKKLPAYSDEQLVANSAEWKASFAIQKSTPERLIAKISTRYVLTEDQKNKICALAQPDEEINDDFVAEMNAAEANDADR